MYPFEATQDELEGNLEHFVDFMFASLVSDFLVMPKGTGFVEYPSFEQGYEILKRKTHAFADVTGETLLSAADEKRIAWIVVRSILGFTPPEWAYVTVQTTGEQVPQGFARTLDRKIRMNPSLPLGTGGLIRKRVKAMMETAAHLMTQGAPKVDNGCLHRLFKADTSEGLTSIAAMAAVGVPYAMLLYERFLGRPFAGHRDSVSELVGDSLESAIEDVLSKGGISYRKTKRAERIPGFDQAPDFIIPSEFNPEVVIEAKITEDDGTARDKVTRIQHLGELSAPAAPGDKPKFEVIGCIAGRGFSVRREDMKKLILATRGKVFTLQHVDMLIEYTALKRFKTR